MRIVVVLAALGVALYALRRWWSQLDSTSQMQWFRTFVIGGGALLLIFLIARGGPGAVALLLPLLLPFLINGRSLMRRFAAATGRAPEHEKSEVKTQYFEMSFDHASGEMQGAVLAGSFAGRRLSELTFPELMLLWRECHSDPQSVAVLETYLDRTQEDDWREHASEDTTKKADNRRSAQGSMSKQEAYEILGLEPGAAVEEIKAAHRRLMQRLHPDHGGSAFLAARINEARDVLLAG